MYTVCAICCNHYIVMNCSTGESSASTPVVILLIVILPVVVLLMLMGALPVMMFVECLSCPNTSNIGSINGSIIPGGASWCKYGQSRYCRLRWNGIIVLRSLSSIIGEMQPLLTPYLYQN